MAEGQEVVVQNNKKLIEEVGVAAVIAVVGGVILYFVLENQNKSSPSPSPSPSPSSSPSPSTISPTISISPSLVYLTSQTGLFGNTSISYSPSSLTITGQGFTPSILGQTGGKVQIQDENGDILSTINTNASGAFTTNLPFSSYKPIAGNGSIMAIDTFTGSKSNSVPITYKATTQLTSTSSTNSQSSSSLLTYLNAGYGSLANSIANGSKVTSPSINSTTLPNNGLPKSEWTGTGIYGSNTNPIAFGDWYLGSSTGIEWHNMGYYQTQNGDSEIYAGSLSSLQAYLSSNNIYQPKATPISTWISINSATVTWGNTVTLSWQGGYEYSGNQYDSGEDMRYGVDWGNGIIQYFTSNTAKLQYTPVPSTATIKITAYTNLDIPYGTASKTVSF